MSQLLKALGIIILSINTAWVYADVDSRRFPSTLTFNNQILQLNGVGTRSKFFVDIYDAGLYLSSKGLAANEIITADKATAIRLVITSKLITGDKMAKVTRDGFKQAAGDEFASIESDVDRLVAVFKDKISVGDYFDLVYTQGQGTRVIKNGEPRTLVKGLKFKQVLFAIWLGDKPAQKSLRKALLNPS